MNKNDLKKLIGECIKEMSNDGDEFKVFNTDVDRSMARQKDLAFGTGEIKFKSNTGTDYTVSIDNGDIIDVVDKRGNKYNVDEIQTYWEKGFTLIRSISATIGDDDSSPPDEEEKPMLHSPEKLQETDKEISEKSKDIPKDVKCKKCGKPVELGTSSTLCPSCHEKSLDDAEKYYGVQEGEDDVSVKDPNDYEDAANKLKDALTATTVSDFVKKFKGIASDPKVQAVLKSGASDGDENDEKILYKKADINVKNLLPTQSEIGFNQSILTLLTDEHNSLASIILEGNANVGGPLVTYNGKYIIDGHHRWSQVYAANPNATLATLDMTGKLDATEILKIVQMSVAAVAKQVPAADPKGINILKETITKEAVLKSVDENLTDKAKAIWANHGEKDNDAIAVLLYKNLENLKKNNRPVVGAPGRIDMPQTDVAGKADIKLDLLARGDINFIDPKGSDVKSENMVNETFKKHLGLLYKKLKLNEIVDIK